ncbi:MAG: ubiquinol-cytochrome c reductase iron-sulfur subunit [Actinobacteria bacterium]|nr:ubiquinol-cytochrome c reductase iron-sulfur subunit [Actinomycetota bacterium]
MSPWRVIVAAILLLLRGGRRGPAPQQPLDPRERRVPFNGRAELLVAALLMLGGLAGLGFALVYLLAPGGETQWLGLAVGVALALIAAALIVAGKAVVPQEIAVEERSELIDEQAEQEVPELLAEGVQGVTRRRLLARAAGVAGIGVGAALVAPAASLGPNVAQRIDATPWRRGVRVVDERGRAILADDVPFGTFVTGFPEGASLRDLASPIVIVRLPPSTIHLPDGRAQAAWAPEGLLAYSKICTHAGCAIALYRYPSFRATQPRPALVCPCHYSTFDPARGADVIFGPAGRPLPQLPLAIDPGTRELRANGGYSGSIGPAWLEVKRGGA